MKTKREFIVPSLPTRNGNSGAASPGVPVRSGSQPTYKEWKHGKRTQPAHQRLRSQPTYKEWKLDPAQVVQPEIESSQPTYKEWKRFPVTLEIGWNIMFPAYLQGMETFSGYLGNRMELHVPSLPTRNGNGVGALTAAPALAFPAYLQGMETGGSTASGKMYSGFPAYLQGMETEVPDFEEV